MSDQKLQLSDFRLAGFLIARGLRLDNTTINDRGDVIFIFDDTDGTATKIVNAYPGSPEAIYDASCKTMYDFVKLHQRRKRVRRG